eukprot:scaffold6323_cov121-Isochrysis_galbana.AAC.2
MTYQECEINHLHRLNVAEHHVQQRAQILGISHRRLKSLGTVVQPAFNRPDFEQGHRRVHNL